MEGLGNVVLLLCSIRSPSAVPGHGFKVDHLCDTSFL